MNLVMARISIAKRLHHVITEFDLDECLLLVLLADFRTSMHLSYASFLGFILFFR